MQLYDGLRQPGKKQSIIYLYRLIMSDRCENLLIPFYLKEKQSLQVSQACLLYAPSSISVIGLDLELDYKLPYPISELNHGFSSIRKQPVTNKGNCGNANDHKGDTDLGYLKEGHSADAAFKHETVDDQIGAGTNQGTGAAKDSGVGKGNEKLGG